MYNKEKRVRKGHQSSYQSSSDDDGGGSSVWSGCCFCWWIFSFRSRPAPAHLDPLLVFPSPLFFL